MPHYKATYLMYRPMRDDLRDICMTSVYFPAEENQEALDKAVAMEDILTFCASGPVHGEKPVVACLKTLHLVKVEEELQEVVSQKEVIDRRLEHYEKTRN